MPRYRFKLTSEEKRELEKRIQKGGKGYSIKHAQILLKLDDIPENGEWTYERIKAAYGACHSTIAGVAQRFVFEGMEAALGRKKRENKPVFITGEVEAHICAIACSSPPEERSRWTMQLIADKLIQLGIVETISDTSVCDVMKKTKSSRGLWKNGASPRQARSS
jgi:hypothetical protein